MEQAQGKPQSFIGVGYSSELALSSIESVFADRSQYMKDRFIGNSHLPIYKRYTIWPREYETDPQIKDYLDDLIRLTTEYMALWDLGNDFTPELVEGFNLQSYRPHQSYHHWHCERSSNGQYARSLTFMTYLNDIPEDCGGGTSFKHHDITVTPERGKTIIWPSDFTHIHRGEVTKTHEKHIVTGWINIQDTKVKKANSQEWQE